VWLGCAARRCGEEDAVFEVREEEVHVAGGAADKAAGIFGVAEIGFSVGLIYASERIARFLRSHN
jgi:hypothetical protein